MVSVIIPTYNGANFIQESLNSVFAQTVLPSEIVIVDDCSTDETPSIVNRIAKDAPVPIRFISLDRNSGGPSRPQNVGIRAADSDYIMLLDQDDLMRPRRIESQLSALKAHPETLVIGRFNIIGNPDGDMTPLWTTSQFAELESILDLPGEFQTLDAELAFSTLLRRNFTGSNSNFCFSRSLWRRVGGFDEKVVRCVDLDFALKAAMSAPITVVPELVFDYRWGNASLNHLSLNTTQIEVALVRLRAATAKPDWAGSSLYDLQYMALDFAQSELKAGNFAKTISITMDVLHYGGVRSFQPIAYRFRRSLRIKRNGNSKGVS